MAYHYLLKDRHRLVQQLACNLLPKGYWFYVSGRIPEDKDPELVDAKLVLTYETHFSKSRAYRRRKAGLATVKYLRLGRTFWLISTRGKGPFFEREEFHDARDRPIVVGGYSVSVNRESGKVSVRVQREAFNKLRMLVMENARAPLADWERFFWRFEFQAYAGVRDQVFALLRLLNQCRKSFRLEPIDWRRCVRKKFTPEPVFLPSSPEMEALLRDV